MLTGSGQHSAEHMVESDFQRSGTKEREGAAEDPNMYAMMGDTHLDADDLTISEIDAVISQLMAAKKQETDQQDSYTGGRELGYEPFSRTCMSSIW